MSPSARNVFLLVSTVVVMTSRSGAQASMPDDSLLYLLDREVVVTATRMPTPFERVPAATEVFHTEEIGRMPARSVADVLGMTTGVAVRVYGAEGSLRLASFRGLGPEYTVIYFNGVRMNDAQSGVVDVGRIALLNVGRIEIARGGYGALYGGDALGGIVDIRSGPLSSPLTLRAGGGSFGWKSMDGSVAFGSASARLRLSALYEDARNDFRFTVPRAPYGEFRRTGSGSIARRVTAEGNALSGASALSVHATVGNSVTGVPGAFTQAGRPGAEQRDADASLALQLRHQLDPATLLEVVPSARFAREEYRDPATVLAGLPIDSRYDNASAGVIASLLRSFGDCARVLGGIEAGFASLASADIAGVPRRLSGALFTSAELRWNGLPALTFFPALRYDHLDDAPVHRTLDVLSPSIGAVWDASNVLSVRARISRGFRSPTFNQLFWRQGGNPLLRPEYSTSVETGLRIASRAGLPDLDVTLFRHDLTDKIVWMPGAGYFWTPKNIQHVLSQGVEARASGETLGGMLRYAAGAQWTSAVKRNSSFPGDATAGKQLVYTPLFSGTASVEVLPVSRLSCSVLARYTGERYSSETNDAASRLDGFVTVDAAASVSVDAMSAAWTLKAELLNVLDASYEVIAFYPMPPRAFRLSLTMLLPSKDTAP
ncbi:MAG: TonB-dependent receptor [Ignavibacteria bacterium]|nr:TonB-dependent receptor [Ignavibacteria bacterium]